MSPRPSLAIAILVLISLGVFLPGLGWGLPGREVDPFLFGDHEVWSGQKILQLAGSSEDPDRGADVASHAGFDRSRVSAVNSTDEERARIVRRYRLMSYQPDEWNTLKSLSEMKPSQGNFDPKLYQYGGLWVYPVGALLKAASVLHLIALRSDVAWYLDHPQAFGRFYVVARLWSVIWAIVGGVTVFALVCRIVGGTVFPALASLCFIFMPVVVNMAHEAKPHLAGAVLMLMAVLAAARYVERGTRAGWIIAGAACGAAVGMVLSAVPIFCLLPVMVAMRRSTWRQKCIACGGAVAVGVAVYLFTNPYVPFNFLWHRQVLISNFGNSRAMYQPRLTQDGLANAAYLVGAGTSPLLALAGVVGALALGCRAVRMRQNTGPAEIRRRATGVLLAVPAVCVIGQCFLFATGKPGEFGRFMLLGDIFLMIEAVVAIATFIPRASIRAIMSAVLIISTAWGGVMYLRAFVRDSRTLTPRLIEAAHLRELSMGPNPALGVIADPAPYCLPPVDLFRWKILLLPKGAGAEDGLAIADVSVQAVDLPARASGEHSPWLQLLSATPISWADKPFDVRVAKEGRPLCLSPE